MRLFVCLCLRACAWVGVGVGVGVGVWTQGSYGEAAEAFEKVMELSGSQPQRVKQSQTGEAAEASVFNLAHCYRKMRRFPEVRHRPFCSLLLAVLVLAVDASCSMHRTRMYGIEHA